MTAVRLHRQRSTEHFENVADAKLFTGCVVEKSRTAGMTLAFQVFIPLELKASTTVVFVSQVEVYPSIERQKHLASLE